MANLEVLSYKFFIDLSVPRSIAADVEQVPGVLVYNIDAIQSKASAALERRLAAVPQVRAIIEESMVGLQDWTKEMLVSPTIQKLKNALEQIRLEELDRYQKKKLSPEEIKRLDDITRSLMQKILKQPVHSAQSRLQARRGRSAHRHAHRPLRPRTPARFSRWLIAAGCKLLAVSLAGPPVILRKAKDLITSDPSAWVTIIVLTVIRSYTSFAQDDGRFNCRSKGSC